jgi:hypothetical protein
MSQSRQDYLLARLFNLTSEEDLVKNCIYLNSVSAASGRLPREHLPLYTSTYFVKIEHQVQLTHIPKERV